MVEELLLMAAAVPEVPLSTRNRRFLEERGEEVTVGTCLRCNSLTVHLGVVVIQSNCGQERQAAPSPRSRATVPIASETGGKKRRLELKPKLFFCWI